jgi:DNA-binding MltR family transcriptional regulator
VSKNKYSDIKFFLGFSDTLKASKDKEIALSVHIRIKPINKCNHHCINNSRNEIIYDFCKWIKIIYLSRSSKAISS